MTTSTTDAEAIARIIDPLAFDVEKQTFCTPAYWKARSKFSLECATAILSYLASRREAQEPVDWIYEDELPSSYPYGRMFAYSKVRDGVRMFPVYAPLPPPPAGEVERLVKPIIDRLEWNGRLQQWVVRPDLPAGTIKAVRAALNGGRSDG